MSNLFELFFSVGDNVSSEIEFCFCCRRNIPESPTSHSPYNSSFRRNSSNAQILARFSEKVYIFPSSEGILSVLELQEFPFLRTHMSRMTQCGHFVVNERPKQSKIQSSQRCQRAHWSTRFYRRVTHILATSFSCDSPNDHRCQF